jgi:hypothetical protein
MIPTDEQFRSKAEVDDYFSGDYITCLLCGREFKSLGSHILRTHEVTVEEYKTRFGLPIVRGLVGQATHERQADAIMARIAAGEASVIMTREQRRKGQSTRIKRKPPPYHYMDMREYAKAGVAVLQNNSADRLNKYDWERVLEIVDYRGVAIWGLRGDIDMPSSWDLNRKKQIDPEWGKRYDAIIHKHRKNETFVQTIKLMTLNGISSREIAKILGISKTHILRIRKLIAGS